MFSEGTDDYLRSSKRDESYSEIVEGIVRDINSTRHMKWTFLVIIIVLLLVICGVGLFVICKISSKENIGYADIGIALTGLASVVSSAIVLPKIVTKHLFPKDIDRVRFEFIRDCQKYDQGTSEYKN